MTEHTHEHATPGEGGLTSFRDLLTTIQKDRIVTESELYELSLRYEAERSVIHQESRRRLEALLLLVAKNTLLETDVERHEVAGFRSVSRMTGLKVESIEDDLVSLERWEESKVEFIRDGESFRQEGLFESLAVGIADKQTYLSEEDIIRSEDILEVERNELGESLDSVETPPSPSTPRMQRTSPRKRPG